MSDSDQATPIESFQYRGQNIEIFLTKKRPDHCGLVSIDPDIDRCALCDAELPLLDKYVFTINGTLVPPFDGDTPDDAREQAKSLIDGGKDREPPREPDVTMGTGKPKPPDPAPPKHRRDRAVTLLDKIQEKGWPEKVAAIFDECGWKK